MYFLQQGPIEQTIIRQCVQQRLPLPDSIANSPILFIGLELYYAAFLELTSCRGASYSSEGPIDWFSIKKWCKENQLDEEQEENMFYFVSRLDKVYLDFKANKLKQILNPSK